jgi:hypothetical protein
MRRATAGVAATPDARRTRNGCRAYAGRHPGEGRPKLFQRCPAPARAQRRTMKNATEKRASATGQAVETPEGGRHLMRTTNVSRHRRAASRSGGAMSAECDGRPVYRRNGPKGAAPHQGKGPPWSQPLPQLRNCEPGTHVNEQISESGTLLDLLSAVEAERAPVFKPTSPISGASR